MILDELESRIKVPGFDLVGSYEAGVPTYKVRLRVRAERKQSVPAVARFVLRLVSQGHRAEGEINVTLGLETEFTRNALEYLYLNQLVTRRFESTESLMVAFAVTDKGKLALKEALAASYVSFLYIQVDGLTGEISSPDDKSLHEGPDLKKRDVWLLHSTPGMRPTAEAFGDKLPALKALFRSQLEDPGSIDQLVEVLDVERAWLAYKPVNVLVFRNRATRQISLQTFEGYEPAPYYDQRLTQRERAGGRVIPDGLLISGLEIEQPSTLISKLRPELEALEKINQQVEDLEAEKEDLASLEESTQQGTDTTTPITERTKRIQDLEAQVQILRKAQRSTRLIRSAEHRDVLKNALASAQQVVFIIAPWINRDAVDEDIINLIKDAIRRGVWIAIGYGMPLRPKETKDKYMDAWVVEQFDKIRKHVKGHRLHIEWLGNTHEKILLCDRKFSIVTSFNWLSYRGDKGFRKETGTYSEEPGMIQQVAQHVFDSFKALPIEFPRT